MCGQILSSQVKKASDGRSDVALSSSQPSKKEKEKEVNATVSSASTSLVSQPENVGSKIAMPTSYVAVKGSQGISLHNTYRTGELLQAGE